MFSFKLISALSSLVLLVSAAPTKGSCDASKVKMTLPADQTSLVVTSPLVMPTTAPKYVALGVGIQNYTCSATTSKFTSIGAVAALFDISCLDKTPAMASIQTTAFNIWKAAPASVSTSALSAIATKVGLTTLLGQHYFVPAASGTGLSPKWDFTSTGKTKGDATAFFIGAKTGDIFAPADPATNVDWLMLNNVSGALATQVFRVDTVAGQPPTSCTPGSSADIQVKYTSKYFLY